MTQISEHDRHDHVAHAPHPSPSGGHSDHHAGHGGHGGHGDHAAQFRERFWWNLLLAVPVVAFSEMFADLLGYTLPVGTGWISPVFGDRHLLLRRLAVPERRRAARSARRQPGMMLLIALAITRRVHREPGDEPRRSGNLDLDFWWELALLVVIMLLGHWLEMKAIGQAQGALAALAELLARRGRARRTGRVRSKRCRSTELRRRRRRARALRRPRPRRRRRSSTARPSSTSRWSPASRDPSPSGSVIASSRARSRPTRRSVCASTRSATTPRSPASSGSSPRPRRPGRAPRRSLTAPRRSSSTSRAPRAIVTFVVWMLLGDRATAVERTVTVLVIACPHALGLAIPLVIALSTALAARAGILVKDRLALERMRDDRHRPLRQDRHAHEGARTSSPTSRALDDDVEPTNALLALAGAVESDSEHPLARAIVTAARARGEVPPASDFHSMTGRGVARHDRWSRRGCRWSSAAS